MSRNIKIFLVLIILIGIWFLQGIYLPPSNEGVSKRFQVESGQGVFETAEKLQKDKLIKNDFWFNVYFLLSGRKSVKAGTYKLDRTMSVAKIFEKLSGGSTIPDKITVVEGWSIEDIGSKLEEKNLYHQEDFYEIVGYPFSEGNKDFQVPTDFEKNYDFLDSKPEELKLEGYLFPDTYYLNEDDEPEALAKKMLNNFESKLEKIKVEGEYSVFEIITMASLIEKEVKTLEDKKMVSDVLWKRLENDMPLQVDATIAYITGRNTTEILQEEKEIDSPYNTYKYNGLPKGPICNPGLQSIKAALNPTSTDYWYYLSVSEKKCPECTEGGTYFSETLEQHNIGKNKYLKDD